MNTDFPLKVYLAGGLITNWQENVISSCADLNFTFFNPKKHKLKSPKEYTTWDLFYVKQADIVFAYMEKENPSGYGLTLEIGYAKALEKTIILVDEKSSTDGFFNDKFNIVKNSSSVVFDNFDNGLKFLKKFQQGISTFKTEINHGIYQ